MAIFHAVLAAQETQSLNGQSLEYLTRPYVGYLTFGIDIAAGIIISISAATALFALRYYASRPRSKLKTRRLLDYV